MSTPEKKTVWRTFANALIAWAESPTGRHTLIAIAAALGAAAEQAIRAAVA